MKTVTRTIKVSTCPKCEKKLSESYWDFCHSCHHRFDESEIKVIEQERTYIIATEQDPYVIEDYPYGFRLRCKYTTWIETSAKNGDRVVSQTVNPKNGRPNAPKKSTYNAVSVLCLDDEGHVTSDSIYQGRYERTINEYVDRVGMENLNETQQKQIEYQIKLARLAHKIYGNYKAEAERQEAAKEQSSNV